ncbi:hypothetical protein BDZ85DRAFT_69214 [Elsinoe ampelina]|uniref:Ribosomal protein L9 domain-containing protein n=1 Tax=Elsinoe ampelina TaxID=302913 RepID=A0A6A6GIZ0_9PEZI|nr:hypothetical protein BDZ85DRAFT_69214 [Elsinoe ampelina]
MSFLTPSIRSPVCSSCTRRILAFISPATSQPWTQQTRHKSSKRRSVKGPDHITVRLNRDVPGFGRKGSYVPISQGHMRNTWHPASIASYISPAERSSIQTRNIPVQRDVLFMAEAMAASGGMSKRRQAAIDAAVRAAGGTMTASSPTPGEGEGDAAERGVVGRGAGGGAQVQVQAVPAKRALELMSVLVPGRMDFRRQVQEGGRGIFGSVSVGDVVERVRDVLGGNEEASRIVIGEEHVRFVETEAEGGKVKTLGQFKVEIGVKGAEGTVARTVRVMPAEEKEKEQGRLVN